MIYDFLPGVGTAGIDQVSIVHFFRWKLISEQKTTGVLALRLWTSHVTSYLAMSGGPPIKESPYFDSNHRLLGATTQLGAA